MGVAVSVQPQTEKEEEEDGERGELRLICHCRWGAEVKNKGTRRWEGGVSAEGGF